MVFFSHKNRTKVFRALVAVIYIAFFTAQLSCRFHVCANFPIVQSLQNSSKAIALEDAPNIDRALILSVDKRYDHEATFALITPFFRLKPNYSTDLHDATVCQPHHKAAIIYRHSLRGPPIA